jgi:DNA-binding PadR family transcriptional regulator
MSLPDILLSLLREPMSGSDLIRLFDGTIRHFWKTDLSQIYRALEALEREGCVRARSVPSRRGPARKVYRLTARGRRRLEAWIQRPPRVPQAKFEYLAQLFSVTADRKPRERARAMLTSMREEAARSVGVLEAIDAAMQQAPGYPDRMPSFLFYPWLTLRHGLYRRRAFLEWIDDSLRWIDRRPEEGEDEISPEALGDLLRLMRTMDRADEAPVNEGDHHD